MSHSFLLCLDLYHAILFDHGIDLLVSLTVCKGQSVIAGKRWMIVVRKCSSSGINLYVAAVSSSNSAFRISFRQKVTDLIDGIVQQIPAGSWIADLAWNITLINQFLTVTGKVPAVLGTDLLDG